MQLILKYVAFQILLFSFHDMLFFFYVRFQLNKYFLKFEIDTVAHTYVLSQHVEDWGRKTCLMAAWTTFQAQDQSGLDSKITSAKERKKDTESPSHYKLICKEAGSQRDIFLLLLLWNITGVHRFP